MNANQEVLLGLSARDLIAASAVLVVLIVGDLLLRWLLGRRARAADRHASLDLANPGGSRPWAAPMLRSLAGPATLLLWTYGVHFALTDVVPADWFSTRHEQVLAIAHWVRGLLTLAALLWLLGRAGRIVERQLSASLATSHTGWNYRLLPLLVRALRLALPFIAAMLAIPMMRLSPELQNLAQNLLTVGLIGALAYLLMQLVGVMTELLLSRYRLDTADNLHARGVHTQVTVLRKLAVAVIFLFALASMLMVFDSVRRLGTAMLASAGIASVIIGFAAQKSLATLLAGFQIAMTQPIRVDDVVIVEGEWGRIEEIALTYVVVKIWDERRLVVPITYFIEKPFQNWTRNSSELLGTVFLYMDYTVPLADLRAEFDRVVTASPLWDGRVKIVQVTDAKERTLELRCLVSTRDAPQGFDLRCEVREKLVDWLQRNHPGALPKERVEGWGPWDEAPRPA